MDTVVELPKASAKGLAPFSLKDAPALIERVFPAQKIGIEAQKERKAGAGQTLTALGSYWKGRKPLILVRATVLASLLPATNDPQADLELFETLMRMDFEGIARRKPKITAAHVWDCADIPIAEKKPHIDTNGIGLAEEETGEAEDESEDETPALRRSVSVAWKRVNLTRFAKLEDEAKKLGREHADEVRATALHPDERRMALARVKAATDEEVSRIRIERDTERRRLEAERHALELRALAALPYGQQVAISERVERVENLSRADDPLYSDVWGQVNSHLGTDATTLPELIEQLGVARFGRRPVVGDPFAGGGSIPFEAARVGCDVVASDLNPVAAMLTWGALNIIGADQARREHIAEEQRRVAAAVDAEITRLGIEHNERGDRAKAYLYCLEVVDPQTGWRVPMAPSWVISRNRRCIARLVPDYVQKRFDILIEEGVSAQALRDAEVGTVRDGHLVYQLAPTSGGDLSEWRISIPRLRGDGEGPEHPDGTRGNRLRLWDITDVVPREPEWAPDAHPVLEGSAPGAWVGGDIWLERLYCIQWMDGHDLARAKGRPRTWFAAPDADDTAREHIVLAKVVQNLSQWQAAGFVADMRIEPGEKTDEPIRTRGWTYWHHLFMPRSLLRLALLAEHGRTEIGWLQRARDADRTAKLCRWNADPQPTQLPKIEQVFSNQALNTLSNWGLYSHAGLEPYFEKISAQKLSNNNANFFSRAAYQVEEIIDIWVYDPPYADAVVYHEITEFFIAWLRKNPPPDFSRWTWDSRRPLAIQGKGGKFRADMVAAFKAMGDHMPDNGLQVCMFTHTDAKVWADMAQIVWGAGLQVTAAWYVSTETTSELKKGGYVQGTVLLVLRKRKGDERAYRDEIVPAIRERVEEQVRTLMGLNQRARGRQRDENLFSRADIQMAGYAAAMEVLTGVTHIDGVDMTREALRPRERGERGLVEEMIELAVQTATELMTPEGIDEALWERLSATERFYLTMTETEADRPQGQPGGKLDDYQNFAKAYRAEGWEDLMADKTPNQARLKGPADFRRAMMTAHSFAEGILRPTLYAINELKIATERDEDAKDAADRVLHGLRDHFSEWVRQRNSVREVTVWLGRMWGRHRPAEAGAARQLAGIIQSERLG